jgi:hypothetical protein
LEFVEDIFRQSGYTYHQICRAFNPPLMEIKGDKAK